MLLRTGREAAARIRGIIQEKFQIHRMSVDLTVKSVARLDPVGRVDFGGGEYHAADLLPVLPMRQRAEDRYEWWDLEGGSYAVEFNETLELGETEIALLEPDSRLLRAGGTHTPAFLRGHVDPIHVFLIVGASRLQIKQNARISSIRLFVLRNTQEKMPIAAKSVLANGLKKTKRRPVREGAKRKR